MNCQKCNKGFYSSTKNRKYCSLSCSTSAVNSSKKKVKQIELINLFEHNTDDKVELKRKWFMFHEGWISLTDVLENRIMHQKFTNNKSEYSYEGFGYFTLVNSDSE